MRWIAILLQTASTKILVNGSPGSSFAHTCGLRQGDPVSLLLFVIAMEALSSLFTKGAEVGAVSSFPGISATQRLSIYADVVALFIRPTNLDLSFVRMALDCFGAASGLVVNYNKSMAIMIKGNEEDQHRVRDILQCAMGSFPCKYLGIPLAIK